VAEYSNPPFPTNPSPIFHSHLKTLLFSVFPSIAVYPLLRLISWNSTTQCLAVTGGGSVGDRGRSSAHLAFGCTV